MLLNSHTHENERRGKKQENAGLENKIVPVVKKFSQTKHCDLYLQYQENSISHHLEGIRGVRSFNKFRGEGAQVVLF